jgi:hypothetical protein
MRRSAAAVALLLAGCPLPQPLPDYPAGTITPPRILATTTTRSSDAFIPVPAGCTTSPRYDLDARIFYPSNVAVEARWFVDYNKNESSRYAIQNTNREVPADENPAILERTVPTFVFHPYGYPPAAELGLPSADPKAQGVLHVVELVVSNGFDPNPGIPEPNRTAAVTDAAARFEIQTFRWVFVNVVVPPAGCGADDIVCCP